MFIAWENTHGHSVTVLMFSSKRSSNVSLACYELKLKVKLKPNKALDKNSSLSYGASPATWDHTVLPATRHK